VLNHVESDIAEVPLIRHAVTAAQAGLAIAKDVPGDAETRREVIRVQVPQFANRTIFGKHNLTIGNALENIVALSQIEIRVKLLSGIMLNAIEFVAHTKI